MKNLNPRLSCESYYLILYPMQMEDKLLMPLIQAVSQWNDNTPVSEAGPVGQDDLTGRAVTSASSDPPNMLMLSDFQINICRALIYVLLGAFRVPVASRAFEVGLIVDS